MFKKSRNALHALVTSLVLSSASQLTAADSTWTGNTDNDLTNPTNWTNNVPNGIATFPVAATEAPFLHSGLFTVNEFLFPSTNAAAYTFDVSSGTSAVLEFGADGIVNNSNLQQEFTIDNNGVISFKSTSSADKTASGKVNFKLKGSGVLEFHDNSKSSNVDIAFLSTGSQVFFGNSGNDIYNGKLSGNGGLQINAFPGTQWTFTGANTYSGQTTIQTGTLRAGANNTFSPNSQIFILTNNGILDLNNFNNTIDSLLGVSGAQVILGSGTLSLAGGGNHIYNGSIQGTGGLTKLSTSLGFFGLNGSHVNTYSGPTILQAGGFEARTVDAFSPFSNIVMSDSAILELNDHDNTIGALSGSSSTNNVNVGKATLTFGNNTNTTYAGGITGTTGTLIAVGTGTFNLTGDASGFTGTTNVENKFFAVNNKLGGNVFVQSGGTLGGTGLILGSVTVNSGGTIEPGNSIGTLHVLGSYTQNANSTYIDEVNSLGQTDLIQITGSATLLGGTVQVEPVGGYAFNTEYVILHTEGNLSGTYANVTAPGLVTPQLSYRDNHDVILKIETDLASAACTPGAVVVANQLDNIAHPNTEQTLILNALVSLSPEEACRALTQISGQQHAATPFVCELVNRQFIRRLYDPLRPIVTTYPCCECRDPCKPDMDAWLEASGGYFSTRGHRDLSGIKMKGYEITGGIQKTFCGDLTVGIAGSYEHDKVDFRHGGDENFNSYFGGLYGLYRPADFYVLADLSYGYTTSKLARHIHLNGLDFHAHSKPKINQFTFYAEAGMDLCLCSMLIQPFVGIEVDSVWRKHLTEHGARDLNLTLFKRDHTNAFSRLGVHLTTMSSCPDDFSLSVDLAWLYRLNGEKNRLNQRFNDFGTSFTIAGANLNRNSFEGAITASKVFCDNWRLYLQASGEVWQKAWGVYGLAGVEYSW